MVVEDMLDGGLVFGMRFDKDGSAGGGFVAHASDGNYFP